MRGDVDQILTATDRIAVIAAQLLNYTRRQAHPASPVNVTQTLAQMEEKIAQAAGEGCAVHSRLGEAVWALADEAQLEEIVLALVSHEREDARERSHVSIGCEIDTIAEHLPGMTLAPGAYARADDSRRRPGPGSGESRRGVRRIPVETGREDARVRRWRAPMRSCASGAETSRSSASRFAARHSWFTCRIARAPAEVAPEPVVEPVRPEPPVEIVRETILLVEDEAGIRALVRKILRRENYNVLEAGSAEEALAMASSAPGRIDLLVTDVKLPAASGRELAERIRETGRTEGPLYFRLHRR